MIACSVGVTLTDGCFWSLQVAQNVFDIFRDNRTPTPNSTSAFCCAHFRLPFITRICPGFQETLRVDENGEEVALAGADIAGIGGPSCGWRDPSTSRGLNEKELMAQYEAIAIRHNSRIRRRGGCVEEMPGHSMRGAGVLVRTHNRHNTRGTRIRKRTRRVLL